MVRLAALAALGGLGLTGCAVMTAGGDPTYHYYPSPPPLEPHFFRGTAPEVADLWHFDQPQTRTLDPQAPADLAWRQALASRGASLRHFAEAYDENALGIDDDIDFIPLELYGVLPPALPR